MHLCTQITINKYINDKSKDNTSLLFLLEVFVGLHHVFGLGLQGLHVPIGDRVVNRDQIILVGPFFLLKI